jgi:hypothetical protein
MSKSDEPKNVDEVEIDYSEVKDPEIQEVIGEEDEVVEKTVKIGWDGRQHIIRIPREISTSLDIDKEDEVEFTMIKPPADSEKSEKLKIAYPKFDDTE